MFSTVVSSTALFSPSYTYSSPSTETAMSSSSSSSSCCLPRTCCFGRRSVLWGARAVAAVDAVLNLAVLVVLFASRPLFERPPGPMQTLFWPAILICMDLMLLHGIKRR